MASRLWVEAGVDDNALASTTAKAHRAAFDAFAIGAADAQLEDEHTLLRMNDKALAAKSITATEHEQCILGVMTKAFLKKGTRILISGLAARTELNGRLATIVGDLRDGRLPVKVPSEATHVRLRPCNMRPVPPAMLSTNYEPGSLVELSGLASASASIYNGCIGEVLPAEEGDERIPVRVNAAGEPKSLRVKPANLCTVGLESCLADGAACLDAGRPCDALTRADFAIELAPSSRVANVLRLRAVRSAGQGEPRTCQVTSPSPNPKPSPSPNPNGQGGAMHVPGD